jgi:hypothetical protein
LSQASSFNASDGLDGPQTAGNSRHSLSSNPHPEGLAADDDSALIELGERFDAVVAEVEILYNQTKPDSFVDELEATLGRLEPIEQAIMAMTARTVAGLGVKARHAAYVMSEQWGAPIDHLDWDARAVRLLIESVCEVARVRLPWSGRTRDARVWRPDPMLPAGEEAESASGTGRGAHL